MKEVVNELNRSPLEVEVMPPEVEPVVNKL
jgi:hypothetical protein